MTTDRDRAPFTLASLVGGATDVPVERVLVLVTSAARALDLFHARGQIHGSICPAAFTVQADGRVVLQEPEPVLEATAWADEGRGYWSPQRSAGEPARRSDDLYALSLVAASLFFGGLPMAEVPAASRLSTRSQADPDRSAALHRVDAALRAQLGWSPAGRPDSGAEIVREIARALSDGGIPAPTQRARQPNAVRRPQRTGHSATICRPARPEGFAPAIRPGTPAPRRPPESAARRHAHTSDPLDMPLAGKWVTAIAIVLCSVYLLPLYFMLFQPR